MIKTYKFYNSTQELLHSYIIALFDKFRNMDDIDFEDSFLDSDFLEIVNRHPDILKDKIIDIYNDVRKWSQINRIKLYEKIKKSNEIEEICKGRCTPELITKNAKGFNKKLRDLFLVLYNQILNGKGFNEKFKTNMLEHYKGFSQLNKEITLCPICGISELKKGHEDFKEQYDHYLPKSKYPLSSINFFNLVPTCKECNSLEVKGEIDIIKETTGKVFYPYNINHKRILLSIGIKNDDTEIDKIEWKVSFNNIDNNTDEIKSWEKIYKIESRYVEFIKGRIDKWYTCYFDFMNDPELSGYSEREKNFIFFKVLEKDESLELSFIKKPALTSFLSDSALAQAQLEVKQHSLQQNTAN